MFQRRIVYHKNYKSTDDEKIRVEHTRVVSSEAKLKKLGPDWGDMPSLKPAPKVVEALENLEVENLIDRAMEAGISKKSLKGKSKQEVIGLLNGAK